MMKKRVLIALRSAAALAVAAVIALCAVAQPGAQAAAHKAGYIQKLEDGPTLDYSGYLNNQVMYKLPSTVSDGQQISVIVTLAEENLLDAYNAAGSGLSFKEYALQSAEAAALRSRIAGSKQQLLSKLDNQGVSYTLGKDYDTLLSGFELVIRAGDFAKVCSSLGKGQDVIVGEEYKVSETQLVTNNVNVYDTGIFNSAGSGFDGTGTVVAVLDTGLDSNHSAFSVQNFNSTNLALTYEDVAAVMDKTTAATILEGLGVDDVYINEKVPFGFDYADQDPDVYSTHNNHGTHVSGVIVGKDDTITGVAPNAQLVSMKIFSDVMDTARTAWILAALEDCVVLGVDVINMSLGTSCGFSRESDEEKLNGVYDKIRESGISMIVAASNSYSSAYGSEANGNLGLTSNPDTGTVGSPSTYGGVMSVASISGVKTPYILYGDTILYFLESTNGSSRENNFFETLLGDQESAEFEFVTIPGVGRTADYTDLDVTGKIVLVRRGSNTFEEKALIAEQMGARGILIYNNISGDIKMNVGDAKLAVCSISQDDGEMLAAVGSGKLTISKQQTSGPFISDFSSWGPTPSLNIKPEITAHGGNILSAITGGGYDRLSGTSMACPNLSGVVLLLRQYVKENFPAIAQDSAAVNEMVNKLMMSTAEIILNKNGLPYAVRKQGAGLANLSNSLATKAYITTYDRNGSPMQTSKIELGDDPDKQGIYTMKFTVTNFGSAALTYNLGGYVLTEGVGDTLTNSGETTVTEEAVLLEGASLAVSINGAEHTGAITVNGGQSLDVTVTLTLSEENKQYLNSSFENGMYVEGFITLTAEAEDVVDLSVPYLAFYGDWTVAPMFDLDYFETNADELDDSIAFEDKTLADAYASRPIGGVYDDYVSYLGSYYFLQDPKDMVISANRDYIALSNQEGTIHSLRFVWAGMLRGAAKIDVCITDDATGEEIYACSDYNVRKSYSDGGASIYPSNIDIEFDTLEFNLENNTRYTVTLTGYLDYGDGGVDSNKKNTITFPLTVDFEAPTVTDVEYYYQYDKSMEKNRLYAKVAVYDNHYAMAAQVGYVTTEADADGNMVPALKTFEQYMTPIYSKCNDTTYVTFELTDYINAIKNGAMNRNTIAITTYDYALNVATYEIGLPDDYVDFYFDGLDEGLTLSPNQVYDLTPLVHPDTSWSELLTYTAQNTNVVRVVNNKLLAVGSGTTVVKAQDLETGKSTKFRVTVLKEGDEGYRRYDPPVADVFRVDGYYTVKAYYMLNSQDKLLGDTGATRFFEGNYELSMYPSESVSLMYTLDAYFPNNTTVSFESSKESVVKVENGVITAVGEGFANVTVRVLVNGKSTYTSETISIEVKDPYVTTGSSLTHYYGNGGMVQIPTDLDLTEIGSFAFSNFDYVPKTEEELAFDDAETSKMWYIGDNTITRVVIPEGVEKINSYAFANLTALEEIVLPSTLESIEYGAFYGCSSLKKIVFSGENNLKIINQHAFEGCNLQGTLDLSAACVVSDYAFAGNVQLRGVTTSDSLLSIGQYAFAGCKMLKNVTITAEKVKYGAYAFTGCEALESFRVNAAVLPEGMFYQCKALKSVTVGPAVNEIGPFALRETAVETITVEAGNTAFKAGSGSYVLSADGKTLAAVAPTILGNVNADTFGGAAITVIGTGAFSHNVGITSVQLPQVTRLDAYAFGSSTALNAVQLGQLTQIGEYAFFETAITQLPAFAGDAWLGKYAFSSTQLTHVEIADGTVLPEGIFSECLKLESVTIGDGVTIGDYAFYTNKDLIFRVEYYTEDGIRYYYYAFSDGLKELTIGSNAIIGANAFANAASLEVVTLGPGAQIGEMAFYNNARLHSIDLSQAVSVGNYAFSGDVYYICRDENMSIAAVDPDGYLMYSYHAPALEQVDLRAANTVGSYAFAYCRQLQQVLLGQNVRALPEYAFAGCISLHSINLSQVQTIGQYAFMEAVLQQADLSSAIEIGEYAFIECATLTDLKLNPNGTKLLEGAFGYCTGLSQVENLAAVPHIGPYAFAYTAITDADLSGAEVIDDFAFMKEQLTPFRVELGSGLQRLGDNPFALCQLEPFHVMEEQVFNGITYEKPNYTYAISDTVQVIDGSLYCQVPNGLELITYAGQTSDNVQVAADTVRVTGMAFAGSDVEMVTLPYTVASLGHKAFFGCEKLTTVVFTSYEAPILEEEFDQIYYETGLHVPGTGVYVYTTDEQGNEVPVEGLGIHPYFMWNATEGAYSNVFYGANFKDYVGYVEQKLVMVRPANGQHYSTFVLDQYFNLRLDGAAAADDVTLAAIAAINAIPERVVYNDRALVEAARAAYNKIATTEQQALVTNIGQLISAEQRILQLTPVPEVPVEPEPVDVSVPWLAWLVMGLGVAVVTAVLVPERCKEARARKAAKAAEQAPQE